MKRFAGTILIFVLAFALNVFLSLGALVAVAAIPRSAIQANMRESAEYLVEKAEEPFIIPDTHSTFVDRFADSLILNIAYHLDPERPLESVMWSEFYGYPNQYAERYLLDSVNGHEDQDPHMQEYLRYWHGSVVPVKLMHLFWNIRQIAVFHCVVLISLLLILLYLLWKENDYTAVKALLISLVIVNAWVVPLGLEFYWVFPVMLVTAIISVKMVEKKCRDFSFMLLFLITGMMTSYLDFLTTETITVTVPLLLIIWIRGRKEDRPFFEELFFCIRCGLIWLAGYLGMWASKWLLAKMFLHIEVMPYVTGHIEERMGSFSGLAALQQMKDAVWRNVIRLFPFDYGLAGAVIFIAGLMILFVIPVARNQLRLKSTMNWKQIALCALLGLIPYLRFVVMHSHSNGHSIFTYRAQIASVLALVFIAVEMMEFVPIQNENRSKGRR